MADRPSQYDKYPDNCDFNKLVRNKVPRKLDETGLIAHWEHVNSDFIFRDLLHEKLREESDEVIAECAAIGTNVVEELGDLLTVMQAIAEYEGIPWDEVVAQSKYKDDTHGDFSDRVFLLRTEAKL